MTLDGIKEVTYRRMTSEIQVDPRTWQEFWEFRGLDKDGIEWKWRCSYVSWVGVDNIYTKLMYTSSLEKVVNEQTPDFFG